MSLRCREFEEALGSESAETQALARLHAGACAACGRALAEDGAFRAATAHLAKSWDSPQLWPGIERALAEEVARAAPKTAAPPAPVWKRPQLAAAVGGLLLAAAAIALYLGEAGQGDGERGASDGPLLTALEEVESVEEQYLAAIERLSKLAKPPRAAESSPLILSQWEKLALLDGAIAELKVVVSQNRFNAHLRRQLLAMYRDKQRTLHDLLEEAP